MQINQDAFSHGQIKSKIWLCETLEPYINPQSTIHILGSWYNTLGFLMSVRKPNYYKAIIGYDINNEFIEVADKLCNAFTFDYSTIYNVNLDCNLVPFDNEDLVINCSSEHMELNWYDNIQKGTLVCIQSSNMGSENLDWQIKNESKTQESFISKYPLSVTHFLGKLEFRYTTLEYDRYMLIGIK